MTLTEPSDQVEHVERTDTVMRPLPTGFLLGTATAAYQIEGAAHEDGRRDSIWDAFSRVPGAIVGGDTGDVACDHYHRMPADVALMKELGLDAYRFSVSWARVRPDGGPVNPAGLDFYSRLVDELLGSGIRPWLTLYHWDLPQALEERGGWTVRETADRFTEYALDVHDALGDRVGIWTTLNEPWCSAFLGYGAGIHAPGRIDREASLLASHHLLLGHGQAIRELRRRDAGLELGVTLNFTVADPDDPTDAGDLDAVRRLDGQHNRWFADPIFRGAYPADVVEDIRTVDPAAVAAFEDAVRPGDLDVIATPIDVLGVNYYQGDLVTSHPERESGPSNEAPTDREIGSVLPADEGIYPVDRGLARTDMGWEIQPEGLTRLLVRLHEDYTDRAGVALVVTENGAAFDDVPDADGAVHDVDRAAFLHAHLDATLDAVDQGARVQGYLAWSLMDNFEWAWGYGKRFGIVRVDYDTQERTVKDSGRMLAAALADRAIPASVPAPV